MSATNRGTNRNKNDFYATPKDVVHNILQTINLNKYGDNILEPGAGNGNICSTIKKIYPNKHITAIELRKEEENNLKQCSNIVIIDDYLNMNINCKYDIIIGNPPYSIAIEFINTSLNILNNNGIIIFLLRTAFLESKSRYDFWQKNPPSGLYTLSKRPSFTGHGTDATSYSWFTWDKSTTNQIIKVI
jgi:hypothetical protein